MKRVILDTSVYGKLVEEPKIAAIILQKVPKEFVIYGTDVIRKELRETPKSLLHKGKKLRGLLLLFYSALVRKDNHDLHYNKLIETLFIAPKGNKQDIISFGAICEPTKHVRILLWVHYKDYLLEYRKKGGNTSTYRAVNKSYGMPDPVFKTYRTFREELLKNQEERPV